jgi:hypothetical protein
METTKKSAKEAAIAVSKTITDVRKVLSAVSIMTKYKWFDEKKFNSEGFDELIKDSCKKYDINESHIRNVGGWNKGYKQDEIID